MAEEAGLLFLGHPAAGGIFIDCGVRESPDLGIGSFGMYEYESADACIRDHRAAFEKGDSKCTSVEVG